MQPLQVRSFFEFQLNSTNTVVFILNNLLKFFLSMNGDFLCLYETPHPYDPLCKDIPFSAHAQRMRMANVDAGNLWRNFPPLSTVHYISIAQFSIRGCLHITLRNQWTTHPPSS